MERKRLSRGVNFISIICLNINLTEYETEIARKYFCILFAR